MQVLLEGLFHLGRLPDSLNFIKDRISIEMYHLVDRVLTEVERLNPESDELGTNVENHMIFKVFLTNLFSKLQSVLDGHIYIIDISSELLHIKPDLDEDGIHMGPEIVPPSPKKHFGSEQSLAPNAFEIYSKREVATAIQNEIKALLYDYLTATEQTTGGMPVLAIAEMLKESKKGVKRQLNQIYKLKTTPEETVKKMFMGICEKVVEEADAGVVESGHRQLVASNPSNILVAYKPTLNFMAQLETKLGMRLANFKMFLEDFIFNSYLPMIQEEILVYFHANVNGIDAFQEEVYGDVEYPLIKSALCMVLQIHGISRLIKNVPVHSSELLKFMEFTLKKFYEKCVGRFRTLIADDKEEAEDEDKSSNVLSVVWAADAELVGIFEKNTYLDSKTVLL
jgi:exocyst complex component 4